MTVCCSAFFVALVLVSLTAVACTAGLITSDVTSGWGCIQGACSGRYTFLSFDLGN